MIPNRGAVFDEVSLECDVRTGEGGEADGVQWRMSRLTLLQVCRSRGSTLGDGLKVWRCVESRWRRFAFV